MSEIADKRQTSSTVYDDVFRTLLEKTPRLFVYLINEVFSEEHAPDTKPVLLANEHMSEPKRVSDSCIKVGDKIYHIECQSHPDASMAIRMIEYDMRIALKYAGKDGYEYNARLPRSCVLYLRHTESTSDELTVHLTLPDGQVVNYSAPLIKVQSYSLDEIFAKKLFVFLPYFVIRYEKEIHEIASYPKKRQGLVNEYRDIITRLEDLDNIGIERFEGAKLLDCMVDVFLKISHLEEALAKEVVSEMRGTVIRTEIDEVYEAGMNKGFDTGFDSGEKAATISNVKNLMHSISVNATRALEILGVTGELRDAVLKDLG